MAQQESLSQAMANLAEDKVKMLIKEKLESGVSADEILKECQTGTIRLRVSKLSVLKTTRR